MTMIVCPTRVRNPVEDSSSQLSFPSRVLANMVFTSSDGTAISFLTNIVSISRLSEYVLKALRRSPELQLQADEAGVACQRIGHRGQLLRQVTQCDNQDIEIFSAAVQCSRDLPSLYGTSGRQLQPNDCYLLVASTNVIARGFKMSMRIAQLREQLATADLLRQTQRGIPGGVRGALDLRYLPNCDSKSEQRNGQGDPGEDSESFRVGC
jgi:hypothetical protein